MNLQQSLGRVPLFRVLLPFVVGILLSQCTLQPVFWIQTCPWVFVAGLGFLACKRYVAAGNYGLRYLNGLGISLLLLALGISDVYIHREDLRAGFFANKLKPKSALFVQITEPPQTKEKSIKALAKVLYLDSMEAGHKASGNLILYFQKDSSATYPKYGDIVKIKNRVSPLQAPKNPGEFDYARFMASQNIYHSAYLRPADWESTSAHGGNALWATIYQIRAGLKAAIAEELPNDSEKGIAEALVLGDEADIPNEVMTEYAGTGTLHILSVSGLHVAIILLVLNAIFSFLVRIPYGRAIKTILVLSLIWAYAFFTGFSPPIARSVIMFSIVFMGTQAAREYNIYNSICAAALILLLFDPLLILQAGFQLSFIALAGIVWIQPEIAKWWQPKHKIGHWFWELAAASLAAQLITLPISILYFNQLSLYFLPANLIVIPASFLVLGLGICYVALYALPFLWIHHAMGWLLWGSISWLNRIVQFINHLPGANWQGLYVSGIGVISLYLLIILSVYSLKYRNKMAFMGALFAALAFLVDRNYDMLQKYATDELNVLATGKDHVVLTLKEKDHLYVLADSSFASDKKQMKFHISGYAFQNYIRPGDITLINLDTTKAFSTDDVLYKFPYLQFHDKRLVVLSRKTMYEVLQTAGNVDAILLDGNPNISLSQLYKKHAFKAVIDGGGNYLKKTRDWETECIENNIPFTNLQAGHFSLQIQ